MSGEFVPSPDPVLYLAIPAHNEVATIGVLLWRLRTVLAEFPREYEVVVYDDASTDETAEVATQYEQAMPVTVLRGQTHVGYAGAVDLLLRHVAAQTRYPRRDAVLLLQGDFTDPPEIVPEFARRFEGGADLVVGERLVVADAPVAVRRLFKGAHWAMRPFVRVDGVRDLTASMRLVRISSLREALRVVGDAPLVTGDTWTANADLLLHLTPHARRVESVPMEPTYGVRMRETRRIAMRDALGALKWAWGARGRRAAIGSAEDGAGDSEKRGARGATSKRRDEPELSIERLREKVRERDGSQGIDGAEPESRRNRRTARDRERPRAERPTEAGTERPARTERPERPDRPPRTERAERSERPEPLDGEERAARPPRERKERAERPDRPERSAAAPAPRGPKPPRGDRPARPRREETRSALDEAMLDDPFAPPAPRLDPLTRALDTPSVARPASAPSSPPATDRSPYADEGDPADRESLVERTETGRSAGPRDRGPRGGREIDHADDPTTTDGALTDDSADEGDGEDVGADESAAGVDAPARKRRRNRRSRRGRKRREGAEGAEGAEGSESSEGPEGAEGADPERALGFSADRGDVDDERPMFERPARDRQDRDDDEGDDEGDDRADSADVFSDGTPEGDAAAQRARRRGRRGRRGGARRSRGRRDRGEGPNDGASDSTSDSTSEGGSDSAGERGGEASGPSDVGAGPNDE